jgi:hypothetical protein
LRVMPAEGGIKIFGSWRVRRYQAGPDGVKLRGCIRIKIVPAERELAALVL